MSGDAGALTECDVKAFQSCSSWAGRVGIVRTSWEGCCCRLLASSIAKMWCFVVPVIAVNGDSTVSLVSFDIVGKLKQNVGVALSALAASPPKSRFDE